MADRLPQAVLFGPRGYQGADWYESVEPDALREQIEHLHEHRGKASVVDPARLLAAAHNWPSNGWARGDVIQTYRLGFLRALSAAHFEAGMGKRSAGVCATGKPALADADHAA